MAEMKDGPLALTSFADPTSDFVVDQAVSDTRLRQHLKMRGPSPTLEKIDGSDRTAGEAIEQYVLASHADMLVMGALGHPRILEFVLGGATRMVIKRPPVPVLHSY